MSLYDAIDMASLNNKKNVAMWIRFLYKQKLCVPCKKCKFDLENLHAKKLQCQQLFLFFIARHINAKMSF